jgi:Leucine-rich repeat (LRR) protein
MKAAVILEDGTYGVRAVLRSAWSNELIEYFARNQVVELELNVAKGWRGQDLSFLAALPNLKSLDVLSLGIRDISPIHCLHKLKWLGITTYCKTKIEFSAFPELESCGLVWRPGAKSLFQCATLKRLSINRYKGKDTDSFESLPDLASLSILNAPVRNLHGLRNLIKLEKLRLAGLRRLTSLAGIEGLKNLEELNINTCRAIGSIQEVGSLLRLKKLHLTNDGDIESLNPLENLAQLEWVTFAESTNILEGDLSVLFRLRNLSRVSFQNRRHYSHRREDFGSAYFGSAHTE